MLRNFCLFACAAYLLINYVNIFTLYIPAYFSYRLQLLNIGCFRALKRLYGAEIKKLMRVDITYILKEDFLPAFYTIYYIIFTELNICRGFRKAGLVLYNPEYIILQLKVRIQSLSRLLIAENLPLSQELKTLNNTIEAYLQTSFI